VVGDEAGRVEDESSKTRASGRAAVLNEDVDRLRGRARQDREFHALPLLERVLEEFAARPKAGQLPAGVVAKEAGCGGGVNDGQIRPLPISAGVRRDGLERGVVASVVTLQHPTEIRVDSVYPVL